MGARGPLPRPTYLTLLQGNPGHRSKSQLAEEQPLPKAEIRIAAPGYLSPRAQAIWRESIGNMPKGLMRQLDTQCLERFCLAKELFEQATANINEFGARCLIGKGRNAVQADNPWLKIRDKQGEIMRACSNEIGMSPAARQRIYANRSQPAAQAKTPKGQTALSKLKQHHPGK